MDCADLSPPEWAHSTCLEAQPEQTGLTGDAPAVICNQSGKVAWANNAWCQLCGFSLHEVLDRNLTLIQGPGTDRETLKSLMAAVRAENAATATLVNYAKGGRPFRHTVDVVPLPGPDGSVVLFRATSREVTSLAPSDAAVSTIDQRMTFTFDADGLRSVDASFTPSFASEIDRHCEHVCSGMPAPKAHPCPTMIVLTDARPPYAIVWASPGWLAVCGFTATEIVGRDLSLIQGPATDKSVVATLMAAVRQSDAVENLELINYTKKRRPFRHHLSVTPVFTEPAQQAPTFYRATSTNLVSLTGENLLSSAGGEEEHLEEGADEFWGDEMEAFGCAWESSWQLAFALDDCHVEMPD